jgi:amidophosphoribosyltransferase
MASAAPPVRHANVYGIDMPTRSELIASGRDETEVCAAAGITEGLLRVAVGLEAVEDIKADLARGLGAA